MRVQKVLDFQSKIAANRRKKKQTKKEEMGQTEQTEQYDNKCQQICHFLRSQKLYCRQGYAKEFLGKFWPS